MYANICILIACHVYILSITVFFVFVNLTILQSSPMLKRSRQPGGSVVPFEPRKSSFPWAEMAEALPVALLITTAERMMKIELMMMMMSQTIMREELSLLQD